MGNPVEEFEHAMETGDVRTLAQGLLSMYRQQGLQNRFQGDGLVASLVVHCFSNLSCGRIYPLLIRQRAPLRKRHYLC